MATVEKRTCRAISKRGERCRRPPVSDGLCTVHSGAQNMKELGRKGGLVKPSTRLRKNVDDDLREQAREVLSKALRGDEVDKAQLDAAKSLFSYRSDAPPSSRREDGEYVGPRIDGRRPTSLADVVTFAAEIGQASPELVAACRLFVDAADAGGARVS